MRFIFASTRFSGIPSTGLEAAMTTADSALPVLMRSNEPLLGMRPVVHQSDALVVGRLVKGPVIVLGARIHPGATAISRRPNKAHMRAVAVRLALAMPAH